MKKINVPKKIFTVSRSHEEICQLFTCISLFSFPQETQTLVRGILQSTEYIMDLTITGNARETGCYTIIDKLLCSNVYVKRLRAILN